MNHTRTALPFCALIALALMTGPPALAQIAEPQVWARLPEPVTNNAVAGVELDGHMMAYSFAGLHEGKTWRDVTSDAYACDLNARECREIAGLPDGIGRLASVAVTLRGQIYIFGGYTVAEDGTEASTPQVWRFDPATETYTHITDMPVPVDDSVALPFADRYVYLVSGWHDTDNTDLVQVYDVRNDRWFEATRFPGAPVFGHAGAMGPTGQILICGGTAVIPPAESGGRRRFAAIDDCWRGVTDAGNPGEIAWSASASIPHGPAYRAAAIALQGGFLLIGGTGNAYNYDGGGYDGIPSEPGAPTRQLACCCIGEEDWFWRTIEDDIFDRVMDLRGVVASRRALFVLGGMRGGQTVSDEVLSVSRAALRPQPVFCGSGRSG